MLFCREQKQNTLPEWKRGILNVKESLYRRKTNKRSTFRRALEDFKGAGFKPCRTLSTPNAAARVHHKTADRQKYKHPFAVLRSCFHRACSSDNFIAAPTPFPRRRTPRELSMSRGQARVSVYNRAVENVQSSWTRFSFNWRPDRGCIFACAN